MTIRHAQRAARKGLQEKGLGMGQQGCHLPGRGGGMPGSPRGCRVLTSLCVPKRVVGTFLGAPRAVRCKGVGTQGVNWRVNF